MKLILIAAISQNNVIGNKGRMPWHSKEEFGHFKEKTIGFPVLMGKNTFNSLGKPLIGRLNIVITSHPELFSQFEDVKCFFNISDALFFCNNGNFEKVFIIGGRRLFEEMMPIADEMMLSRMRFDADGDTFFPEMNFNDWNEVSKEEFNDFEFVTYTKKK